MPNAPAPLMGLRFSNIPAPLIHNLLADLTDQHHLEITDQTVVDDVADRSASTTCVFWTA
jgi:hypothetical protein